MFLKRSAALIVIIFCLNIPARAAMYTIENPAEKINNPADKMYNPATQVNNPASNIYNPAGQMTNPNPLSPPTQAVPQPTATEATTTKRPAKQIIELTKQIKVLPKPNIAAKNYYFKTTRNYIIAAKKAFVKDDYTEFISITEDALRRINAGSLKASKKTRQQLTNYRIFGYGLLEKDGD